MHLEHAIDKKPAVLICDKHPFAEEEKAISEWVGGSKLRKFATKFALERCVHFQATLYQTTFMEIMSF